MVGVNDFPPPSRDGEIFSGRKGLLFDVFRKGDFIPVIPVVLDDIFRDIAHKFISIASPQLIGPHPGACAVFADFIAIKIQVAPPQVPLPDDGMRIACLIKRIFFIHADMEKFRCLEKFHRFRDQIFAHLIIDRGGNHAAVFFQPRIMSGGKVEFGIKGDAQISAPFDLFLQFCGRPRSGSHDFRMTFKFNTVTHIQKNGVDTGFRAAAEQILPDFFIKNQVIGERSRLVAPHISGEMDQNGLEHSTILSLYVSVL